MEGRRGRAYLDQNVLIYLGREPKPLVGFDVVFSVEHYAEVARGSDREVLSTLDRLGAVKLDLSLDGRFRIGNTASIVPISSVAADFEIYLATRVAGMPEIEMFSEFIARSFGGDTLQGLLSKLKEMPDRLSRVLERSPEEAERLVPYSTRVAVRLTEIVQNRMSEKLKVDDLRRQMGTDSGKIGHWQGEHVLDDIWNVISQTVNGVTFDQFFGFDPVDKLGYDVWPHYLSIVSCYTMLNFLGFRPDRDLRTTDGVARSLSDASHVGYAAYCDLFVTADKRVAQKARAIYANRGIGTEVLLAVPNSGGPRAIY